MLFDLSNRWTCGEIEGNSRTICGYDVAFKVLPIRQRFDLGIELAAVMRDKTFDLSMLTDTTVRALVRKLIALSDAPKELFESDLTTQIPVASTALEINLAGFFDSQDRLMLSASRNKAIRKAFSKSNDGDDSAKIGPSITKYWFLWRPVYSEMCSYKAMFIDETFSFADIHEMHELLDVKQYNEIVANHVDT